MHKFNGGIQVVTHYNFFLSETLKRDYLHNKDRNI